MASQAPAFPPGNSCQARGSRLGAHPRTPPLPVDYVTKWFADRLRDVVGLCLGYVSAMADRYSCHETADGWLGKLYIGSKQQIPVSHDLVRSVQYQIPAAGSRVQYIYIPMQARRGSDRSVEELKGKSEKKMRMNKRETGNIHM